MFSCSPVEVDWCLDGGNGFALVDMALLWRTICHWHIIKHNRKKKDQNNNDDHTYTIPITTTRAAIKLKKSSQENEIFTEETLSLSVSNKKKKWISSSHHVTDTQLQYTISCSSPSSCVYVRSQRLKSLHTVSVRPYVHKPIIICLCKW